MDGSEVKFDFIGFKCTPRLKQHLLDACERNGITLSKLICHILYRWCLEFEIGVDHD